MPQSFPFSQQELNKYANQKVLILFERLSDQQKQWVWHFIQLIKKQFPNADHYAVTGSGSVPYMSIGQKSKTAQKGYPFFNIYYSHQHPHIWVNSSRLPDDKIKKKDRDLSFDQHSLDQMNEWFERMVTVLEKSQLSINGLGLIPKDYGDITIEEDSQGHPPNELIQLTCDMSKLNQILYGPPGTGKTYATIDEALKILDPSFYEGVNLDNTLNQEDKRIQLKARFDDLVEDKQVRFVTFHQSFSYEDFVEGIRASSEEGQLKYKVEDGVFKTICASAEARVVKQEHEPIELKNRRIWKMSLGEASSSDESYIYDECIEKNHILLGYGGVSDFSHCKNKADITSVFEKSGSKFKDYAVTAVEIFLLKLQIGDLVVISDGNSKFRAIAEITGNYKCLSREVEDDGYGQCREVRWLQIYAKSRPADDILDKNFMMKSIYRLRDGSINLSKLSKLLNPVDTTLDQSDINTAKVLIIDEINRGNISRIFGELITLIEPSKRAGEDEALEVTLPYSKDPFSVPNNVYLIGTMNTADRSLAGVDIALRRRFSFIEMPPKPELLKEVIVEGVDIEKLLTVMNQRIEVLLDRDHCLVILARKLDSCTL